MTSQSMPPVIQAVGIACVPVDDMPPGTTLARKPVAAAVVTLSQRDDGHRDVIITCMSDARNMEFPLPVLINDALVASAPTIITIADCEVLAVDAASRRFFVEPMLGTLANGQNRIDPVAMFGSGHDEVALCRRLGIPLNTISDCGIARLWNRDAPQAAEDLALIMAAARLTLWAHGASFHSGRPDAFFETILPLRLKLMDMDDERPSLKPLVASRPFHRSASFASYYRDYCVERGAGDDNRWLTFEDGQSYV